MAARAAGPDDPVDWDKVARLVVVSYRVLVQKKLAKWVDLAQRWL